MSFNSSGKHQKEDQDHGISQGRSHGDYTEQYLQQVEFAPVPLQNIYEGNSQTTESYKHMSGLNNTDCMSQMTPLFPIRDNQSMNQDQIFNQSMPVTGGQPVMQTAVPTPQSQYLPTSQTTLNPMANHVAAAGGSITDTNMAPSSGQGFVNMIKDKEEKAQSLGTSIQKHIKGSNQSELSGMNTPQNIIDGNASLNSRVSTSQRLLSQSHKGEILDTQWLSNSKIAEVDGFKDAPDGTQIYLGSSGDLSKQLSMTQKSSSQYALDLNNNNVFISQSQDGIWVDFNLKLLLKIVNSLQSIKALRGQDKWDEIQIRLSEYFNQVQLEENALQDGQHSLQSQKINVQSINDFYKELYKQICLCPEELTGSKQSQGQQSKSVTILTLKEIDMNVLLEVFDIMNELSAYTISSSPPGQNSDRFHNTKNFLNLAIALKDAIGLSLDENEFEGLTNEADQEELKLSLSARLFPNISCYYQNHLGESRMAQNFMSKASEAMAALKNFQQQKIAKLLNISKNENISIHQQNHVSQIQNDREVAIQYNNQAVLELRQNNAQKAFKYAQQSVILLEKPVFEQIDKFGKDLITPKTQVSTPQNELMPPFEQSLVPSNKQDFLEMVQALLISYFNLGSSYELFHNSQQTQQNQNLATALNIYNKAFQLAQRYLDQNQLIYQKLQHKTMKLQEQLKPPEEVRRRSEEMNSDAGVSTHYRKQSNSTQNSQISEQTKFQDIMVKNQEQFQKQVMADLQEKYDFMLKQSMAKFESDYRAEQEQKATNQEEAEEKRLQEEQQKRNTEAESSALAIKKDNFKSADSKLEQKDEKLVGTPEFTSLKQADLELQIQANLNENMDKIKKAMQEQIQADMQKLFEKQAEQKNEEIELERAKLKVESEQLKVLAAQLQNQISTVSYQDSQPPKEKKIENQKSGQSKLLKKELSNILSEDSTLERNKKEMPVIKLVQAESKPGGVDSSRITRLQLPIPNSQAERRSSSRYQMQRGNSKDNKYGNTTPIQKNIGRASASQLQQEYMSSDGRATFQRTQKSDSQKDMNNSQIFVNVSKLQDSQEHLGSSGKRQPEGISSSSGLAKNNTNKALCHLKIPINDFSEIDIDQLILEEQYFYDASRAFLNNNSEILREIDEKKKIVLSKIVYCGGMYNKFTITARCNQTASTEIGLAQGNMQGAGPKDNTKFVSHQPVFQITGYCQDPQIHIRKITLQRYELEAIMQMHAIKEVLPPYMSMSHIRTFEQMSKYLIFPFIYLVIPPENQTPQEQQEVSSESDPTQHEEASSQISHNLSYASNPQKVKVELWGHAPGLVKCDVNINFLGDHCHVSIHYIEDMNFRVSITSLEHESGGLNQLLLDMIVDEQSFDYLFKLQNPKEFTQNDLHTPVQGDKTTEETCIESVEILDLKFYTIISPCIKAYEELLCEQLGTETTFDNVCLDPKGIIYQIRISEASEEVSPKVELWALLDCQRQGNFIVRCQTLYDLRVKKRISEQVVRTHNVNYPEFNSLFGIKKHELNRSQLIMFGAKYLSTLRLFMPTMGMQINEDSDQEEQVIIKQKPISCLAYARRILRYPEIEPDINGLAGMPCVVTIQLLGVNDKDFLGVKITKFSEKNMNELGFFFFVQQKRWKMNDKDKLDYSPKRVTSRTKKEPLLQQYWLVQLLRQYGFNYIFDKIKIINNNICWELLSTGEDSKSESVKEDVLESYLTPSQIDRKLLVKGQTF